LNHEEIKGKGESGKKKGEMDKVEKKNEKEK